jgi:hypothetical protein
MWDSAPHVFTYKSIIFSLNDTSEITCCGKYSQTGWLSCKADCSTVQAQRMVQAPTHSTKLNVISEPTRGAMQSVNKKESFHKLV